jgi:putative transposase
MFSPFAALIVQLRNAIADRRDLLLENAALRQQLAIYQRKGKRPPLTFTDRLFWAWLSRSWPRWRSALFIVQPEAVIRWHRN